ncbi:MAG TPA: ribosome recycling factor [Bacteroidetes bacterium]|nr:ribosome recycling factor [Bacteroidota bacterium]
MDRDDILLDADERMDKSVLVFRQHLGQVRTGKASAALLNGIKINLYGAEMELTQCANLLTPEPRLIVVQPYDKNAIPVIEKAILTSDLGLNPVNDGTVIRIAIPQLTEERRKELVKIVHRYAEDARTAVRQVRRDANENLKKLEKDGDLPEDEMYRALDEVQKLTDSHIKQIDEAMEEKEKEILEV